MSCAATDISWTVDGVLLTVPETLCRSISGQLITWDCVVMAGGQIVSTLSRKNADMNPDRCITHLSGYSHLIKSAVIWFPVLYVSYVRTLALINHYIFFSSIVFPSYDLPDSFCHTTPWSWTTCTSSSLLSCNLSFFFYPDKTPPRVFFPFWLEIVECTVAPVAMEDSDHEVHSSSDEQDSCPASPTHSRDRDAEQVSVTTDQINSELPLRKQLLSWCSVSCHSNPLHPQLMYQHNMSHSTFPLLDLNGLIAFWGLLHYLSCRESVVCVCVGGGAVVCGVHNMRAGCTSAAYPPPAETD